MKKISVEIENRIVFLTEKGGSARKIGKALQISHYVVLSVRKRRNVQPVSTIGGRPRLLTDGDARLMERLMKNKDTKTSKLTAKAINKNVNEWTARRALRRIGLVSAIKLKKPAVLHKKVKARLEFCKTYGKWTVDE